MAAKKPVRAKSPRGAASIGRDAGGNPDGRQLQGGQPKRTSGRGSSIQGEKQAARGGNAGANQGGAPRGVSRLESSTVKKGTGRVSGKRSVRRSGGSRPGRGA